MAYGILMPQLGLTMEEGTVTTWLKHEGDAVAAGDPLLEITTDKLTNEVNSEFAGTLLKIVAKEGEDIPVKGLLGYIGEPGEDVGVFTAPVPAEVASPITKTATKRIKISPLAKKTAEKMGICYSNIQGTGTKGRIIQKDILEAAKDLAAIPLPAPVVTPAESTVELMEGDVVLKMSGMRKVVAERMLKSVTECPTVTQVVKCDVTELLKFRKEVNDKVSVKYSVNDYVLKAVAKALKNNRYMLVSTDGKNVIQRAHVNLGMAVALDEEGLLTPVIKDADKLSLSEIHNVAHDLASRARSGELAVEEYKGSTFTISNLGMFGVESFNPIINQPDSSILGVCCTEDELALDTDGKVIVKKMMRICHTFDHRLIDGSVAAKFEKAVKALLENPMDILM